jgi:hypothetical protein
MSSIGPLTILAIEISRELFLVEIVINLFLIKGTSEEKN